MLKNFKRQVKIATMFSRAKRYGERFPWKYQQAIFMKTQADFAEYIEEEAARHPDVNWAYVNEEYLPIRADELLKEYFSNKWWAKAIIKWAPKNIAASFVEGATKANRETWANSVFGESQCEERDGEDLVLLNLNVISQKWDLHDFKCTADLKDVVQSIVKHEFRHAEQIKALRAAGGPKLVVKAFDIKKNVTYGTDPMEWDAFMTQIGKNEPIEKMVQEVIYY